MTHDIRAPEVERYLLSQGAYEGKAIRIDQTYPVGGFDLLRETVEDATGLAIDYQVAFHDGFIVRLIDELFGAIEVEVPKSFVANPIYLDGVKHGPRSFERGVMQMDGLTVLQYIKSVPLVEGGGYYGQELEHNARKHGVFEGISAELQSEEMGFAFAIRLVRFLADRQSDGSLASDIDIGRLFLDRLDALATLGTALLWDQENTFKLPAIATTLYIVDSAHGDGGVQWIAANDSPQTKADLVAERYPHPAFEVPLHANPYGNLVTEYWPSVRATVRAALETPH
jgi:hypothetical protein